MAAQLRADALRRALDLAEEGDGRELETARALLEQRPEPSAAAWRLAIEAGLRFLGSPGAPPRLPLPSDAKLTSHGLYWLGREALLAFDPEAVERCARTAETLSPVDDVDGLRLSLTRALGQLAKGDADLPSLKQLERDAGRAKHAGFVIDAASLAALAEAAAGNGAGALETARRASRMARTEGLPQREYLANLVLSRMRRLNGAPHLAARIALALRTFASAPWHAWIDWELFLTGARRETGGGERVLGDLLAAAGTGDRTSYEAARFAARDRVRGLAPFAEDVDVVNALLDPIADREPAVTRDFREGRDPVIPQGLRGLAASHSGDGVLALVVAQRPGTARRLLAPGRRLLRGSPPSSPRRKARTEAILCALALAGEGGMSDPSLFHSVYGFEYVPELHSNVLAVALHRARRELPSGAELVHEAGESRLRLGAAIAIPDPRCVTPAEERVLHFLGQVDTASARDVAEALDVPLRSVQAAMTALVAEGMCSQRKLGRRVEYQVDDTTFQVPTRHR